jgi:hypothetical protein
LDLPHLQHDVDRPRDLRHLLGAGTLAPDSATWRFLVASGLAARLTPRAGSALRAGGALVAAAPGRRSPS